MENKKASSFWAGLVWFIIGLIIGLVFLGWWLWPVNWIGGTISTLQPVNQNDYLRTIIDAFSFNSDPGLAFMRFALIGTKREALLQQLYQSPEPLTPQQIEKFAAAVGASEALTSPMIAPAAPNTDSLIIEWFIVKPRWAQIGLAVLLGSLIYAIITITIRVRAKRSHASIGKPVIKSFADLTDEKSRPTAKRNLFPTLGRNVSFWLGALIIGLFFLAALAAPLLAPPDPDLEFSTFKDIGELNRYVPFQPKPGLLLGSVPDPANRRQLDIWYSLVWGTRSALRFGLLVVMFTGTFGIILGGVSAYLGGTLNILIMGFTDAFLTFPIIAGVIFFNQFILMLLSSSGILVFWNGMLPILGDSPTAWQLFLMDLDPLLIAFIVFSWMPYARLMNSVVFITRQEEYVLAARSVGVRPLRLIIRHILPNTISPAVIMAARDVGYVVLLQAGFTLIGLSHRSEWGELLSLGRKYVMGPGGNPFTWMWIYLPPTLAIVFFGIGWNLLGDGLNDLMNPYQLRRINSK